MRFGTGTGHGTLLESRTMFRARRHRGYDLSSPHVKASGRDIQQAAVFELMAQDPAATVGQFALITFTNKAADELKSRLADALRKIEAAASDADQRRRWASAHEHLGNAYVGTIHGFCRQILKTFGYGADVARLSDMDFAGGLLYEAIEEAVEETVLGARDQSLRAALGRKW